MSQISPGMSRDEVEAILGKPDDVITMYDPGGIPGEIWCYGANGHLTMDTLGSICINENGIVQAVFGEKGAPPPAWMFTEEELRTILRILDETPSYNYGLGYNPRGVIRAVNALQPLGKEKALAAVAEYLRVTHASLDALSNNGIGPDGAPDYGMLFNQTLWLLDSVYEVDEVEDARFNDKLFGATSGEREKAAAAISRLKLRWDVKRQDYTFANGATPRIDRPGPYRRNIWKPDIPELDLTMTIERISRKAVEVSVSWTGEKQELCDRPGGISIYNASGRSLPIAQIKLEYLENGSTSTGATIKVEEGQVLFAVFEGAKTTSQSPEYKP